MFPKRAKVVNILYDDYDILIARPSKWGNPFKKGTRKQIIEKYEKYIRGNEEMMADIPNLAGKRLGCFCKPKSCHGDVLVKILNEYIQDKINSAFFRKDGEEDD